MSSSSSSSNNMPRTRLLLNGGDNMLGRAVQLSFPTQSPGEEDITDSCPAWHYLDMCLGHPSGHATAPSQKDPSLEEIRMLNRDGQYLWGDYLKNLTLHPPPDLRLLNLETAVTTSIHNRDVPRYKGIRYHLHVDNLGPAMRAFRQAKHGGAIAADDENATLSPVVLSFANNHCMDYGRRAFEEETLPCLQAHQDLFWTVGCGRNLAEAQRPVVIPRRNSNDDDGGGMNVEIYAFSTGCSGTPPDWYATPRRSGLVGLPGLYDRRAVEEAKEILQSVFHHDDDDKAPPRHADSSPLLRVVSIHWGPNWALKGESEEQLAARRTLARWLVDDCHVDLVYGHSSHHVRGMEVYKNKLILYGTGDMINDYEGFENPGEEKYNRLGGIFVADYVGNDFDQLRIVPMFMNRLRLERYTRDSKIWKPNERRLDADPNKSEDFCRFLNGMSRVDTGSNGVALKLEHVDSDPSIPGGPILRSKPQGSSV